MQIAFILMAQSAHLVYSRFWVQFLVGLYPKKTQKSHTCRTYLVKYLSGSYLLLPSILFKIKLASVGAALNKNRYLLYIYSYYVMKTDETLFPIPNNSENKNNISNKNVN